MGETTLVYGRWVITAADEEPLSDAAVLIEDGRIARVGPYAALRRTHPHAEILGGADKAVMPGLINAHHHSHAVSSVQHAIPDLLLEPWILAWHAMRLEDRYLDTLISAGVQLGSGVTAMVDVLNAGGDAEACDGGIREALRAHGEAGARVALAAGVSFQSFLVCGAGEDERFLASLPASVRAHARSLLPDGPRVGESEYFDLMEGVQRDYAAHERIDCWYGPPGPQWVPDECMQRVASEAERWDCGVQTHVNESLYEKLHGPRFYGVPTMVHLERLGVLGPRFSIAHGTWLNEEEIEVMARSGAAVSHNPSSNLRLRAGVAPFQALLQAGVTTGMGMDSTTLNDNEDMFAEMRLGLRLQRNPLAGTPAPEPAGVLAAATLGGARLMRSETRIGRLAPGFAADLVVLDTGPLVWPWAAPECDPRDLVVLRAQRGDVEQVLVDGEVVWRDGRPTRFDIEAAAREYAERLDAAPFPQAVHESVRAVMPHLEAWYADWPVPELEPWMRYGSRR